MRKSLALAAAAALAACNPSSVPSQANPDGGAAADPPDKISINLEDAQVGDVLRAITSAARKPLVVDPDAQAIASCARISVIMADPVPVQTALRLVGEALQPSGLSLVESNGGGFIVRRVPGAPLPATCAVAARPGAPADAQRPPRVTPDPEVLKKILAGIRIASETQIEVTETARDLAFEHSGRLSRVRIVPAMRDGASTGLKLFGIRKDDVAGALGFRNGDLLISVGGKPVTSPDLALQAYTAIRQATVIEVLIERRGQPMTLTYRIVKRLGGP